MFEIWLRIPSTTYHCAPVLQGSNLDLISHLKTSKPFVMSKGKPMRPQSLLKKWKKEPYMMRLYGIMCEPSTLNLGVEEFIQSLGVSHVSHLAKRETSWQRMTPVTSGPNSSGSLAKFDQISSSWKTSQVSLNLQHLPFSQTWPKWGIMRHGVLSKQVMWEPCTIERGGFAWHGKMVMMPTPTSNPSYRHPIGNSKKHPGYQRMLAMLPTPNAMNALRTGKEIDPVYWLESAKKWKKKGINKHFPLPMAVQTNGINPIKNPSVINSIKIGGKLNPEWVEWLMGWPIGWTESAPVEMESCPPKLQKPLPSFTSNTKTSNRAAAYLLKHKKTDLSDFRTPKYLIDWIERSYGPIDFDAACDPGINNLYSPLRLEDKWPKGSTIYSNPPWDTPSIKKWFEKGLQHTKNGGIHIMLIPNKLCQKVFCDHINPYLETVVFLGGRINFEGPNIVKGGSSRTGCLILVNTPKKIKVIDSINLSDIKRTVNEMEVI